MSTLATISVKSTLSNQEGRAIVSTRGQHIIIDSPPPLGGPNEEFNPLDILLAALATCGTFVLETAAKELEFKLDFVSLTVNAKFDPRGVKGIEGVDPRIQSFDAIISTKGIPQSEVLILIEEFKKRCPVYTTLARSAPINITFN